MDFRTDEEKTLDDLVARVHRMEEALRMLLSKCSCTVPERYSGHRVGCTVPDALYVLNGDDAAAHEEERISRAREG